MNIHSGYLSDCIGRIAQMHADYYAATTDFGVEFEAKVATELAEFCRGYRAGRDGLWLAVDGKQIEGSIVIDGSHHAEQGAHPARRAVGQGGQRAAVRPTIGVRVSSPDSLAVRQQRGRVASIESGSASVFIHQR